MPESESCFRLREIIISRFQNAGLPHSTAMLRGTIDWLLALHAQVSHAALNVVAEKSKWATRNFCKLIIRPNIFRQDTIFNGITLK